MNALMNWCLVFLLLVQVGDIHAHNVVSGVYTEGMKIEGEIGFSNGEMAEAGSLVKVLNATGQEIAEVPLVEGGLFIYEAQTVEKHVFKANLSAGHIAEMVVEADELIAATTPETLTREVFLSGSSAIKEDKSDKTGAVLDTSKSIQTLTANQLQSIMRSAVAQQVKPLQKELRAYKEKVMFRDIAGGLGFIFGLFGVAAWVSSQRKTGEGNASVS